MTTARFVLTLAWRESRAARRRLVLFTGAIAIGVAALVAINSFTQNLQDSVRSQARALLGADLSLRSRSPFPTGVEALLDTLACQAAGGTPAGEPVQPGGAAPLCGHRNLARVTSFAAMAYVPRTTGTRLVQVAAVDGDYPFYGEIKTDPAGEWQRLQSGRRVLVDPGLLASLYAVVGDTLALGEARFEITGTILNVPGEVGVRAAFGPRIAIPARYLDDTKLLGFGARAQYEAFLRLSGGTEAQTLADRYRPLLREQRVSIRTIAEDQRNLNEVLTRLARYLGLVGLIALLLGGLGVASAVHVFIHQKIDTVALLRCLGASSSRLLAVYLVQAGAMGLLGSSVGVLLGVTLQFMLPAVLRDFLPVDVAVAPSWLSIASGLAVGIWVALVFALLPLLAVRQVSPLATLRRPFEARRRSRDPWRWPANGLLAASVVALAVLQVGDWRSGAIFAGGIGLALAVLWLAAFALIRGVRRWFPTGLPYLWRQGLANLYRPANQTVVLVLALGFGAFLLSTLFLVQHNLLRDLRMGGSGGQPNLVLFDIQTDQEKSVAEELRRSSLTGTSPVPIVPMRIVSVKGRPVTQILAASDSTPEGGEPANAWAFRREYRSTYRDTTVASEKIVLGAWWKQGADRRTAAMADRAIPISVESGLAGELGVTIGDEIVWDVQGVQLVSTVSSLREVEWARFEPNFFVVFPRGPLDSAPQTLVLLSRINDEAERARLQRRMAEHFPNVTTLDLSVIQQALERVISRVVVAIRFMALFSLATGAVVLIGAVATSRFQRIREGVLLKTLGATRRQVASIVFSEYVCLGLLAGVTAIALATAAGWAVVKFVFDDRFATPLIPLGALAIAVVVLTVGVGLWNSTEVFRRTPLELLREQ